MLMGETDHLWLIAVACLVVSAGCLGLGDDGGPVDAASTAAEDTGGENATASGPWHGETELRIAESEMTSATAVEADVACAFGGAPQMERTGNRVLPGAQELAVTVETSPTSAGLQVGYVVDPDAPDYAEDEDAITWLDAVPPSSSETFTVDVAADQVEEPGEALAWTFYVRVNPGVDQLCYTGASVGPRSVVVDAVREAGT